MRSLAFRIAVAVLLAPCVPAAAEPPVLLPEVSVRLEAARYRPVETDLHWMGWIGAGAGLVRAGGVTLLFDAGVETILGNTRRPFEATQANYHLGLALRKRMRSATAAVFFDHVSRHYLDRAKDPAVDWNLLGLRVSGRLARGRWAASLGHTTLASLVGYRWEATGALESDLRARTPTPYGRVAARVVTVDQTPELPRGGFMDLAAEAGVRLGGGGRSLQFFAAFERRNDVFLEVPGARNRGLVGFRIVFEQGGAAPRPLNPPPPL